MTQQNTGPLKRRFYLAKCEQTRMICSATCYDHSKNSCTLCHQQGRRPFKWHGARGSRLENAVTHLCFVRVIHLQVRPVPYFSSLEMRVWGNTEKALTRIWQGPRCQTKDLSSHPLCQSSRFHIFKFKINSTFNTWHLFSCPGQLNRWPCHSVSEWVSEWVRFWY